MSERDEKLFILREVHLELQDKLDELEDRKHKGRSPYSLGLRAAADIVSAKIDEVIEESVNDFFHG